jgi:hypothetical protein
MMKRIILTLCAVCTLAVTTIVYARAQKPGDITGHIYSTDIVATIDGMKIPSYNIGGKTVVSELDLPGYGFIVKWNAELRSLSIGMGPKPETAPQAAVTTHKPGLILGDVYYSDIDVWVNGNRIHGYNIGGQTMLALEDLGSEVPDSYYPNYSREIGYSNYGFKTVWDQGARTISAYCLRAGTAVDTAYGTFQIIGTSTFYHAAADVYGGLCLVVQTEQEPDGEDYVGAKAFFDYYDMAYDITGGVLKAEDTGGKSISFEYLSTRRNVSNGLLPIVEIPAVIGGASQCTIRGVIYRGEVYLAYNALFDALA